MPKLTKRCVDAAQPNGKDYILWDDEVSGFGLRVFSSGKRSYLIQYRADGRTRRVTVGPHGVLAPEEARRAAKILLGRIANGENPAEERDAERKLITVKELCVQYMADAEKGLILGKKRQPKKASTLLVDRGRITRHINPLLGSRRVKDITTADVNRFMRDVAAGKTRINQKTRPRGRAIVRGGLGTGARTVGLLGGIFSYAVEQGIIPVNPARGVRRPASNIRDRHLSAEEYRTLGKILSSCDPKGGIGIAIPMIRLLALTGCRRGEIVNLRWSEVDEAKGCFRLQDTKEGRSIRPMGQAVFSLLAELRPDQPLEFVFPGAAEGKPFIGLPKAWRQIFKTSRLSDITPHVLRHSFASTANELGFTEATIGAMLGHSRGTVTSRYIHHVDAVLVNAANIVSTHFAELIEQGRSGCSEEQAEFDFEPLIIEPSTSSGRRSDLRC